MQKKKFNGHSLMVELECFDGNDIIDVILSKYVGEMILNDFLEIIQIYHLIVCILKLLSHIINIIMITNDTHHYFQV